MNLFVYGTLKNRAQLSFVLRRKYTNEYLPATLVDFVLKKPHFFMVFEQPGARVDGYLALGLSVSDIQRLDLYEGVEIGLYRRKEVEVETKRDDGIIKFTAFVYYNGETYNVLEHD